MSKSRARSLKALALLRKTELDRQAAALVGLRGIGAKIEAAREDSHNRAAEAGAVSDLSVMPYMRDYLCSIDRELQQLDEDEAALAREITAQQARLAQAWRGLRVIEKVAERDAARAVAAAILQDEKQQDELALIAYVKSAGA